MIEVKIGNSFELIKTLEDKSVDCVITSPPYFGLRDYKTKPIIFDGVSNCNHDFSIEIIIKQIGIYINIFNSICRTV